MDAAANAFANKTLFIGLAVGFLVGFVMGRVL